MILINVIKLDLNNISYLLLMLSLQFIPAERRKENESTFRYLLEVFKRILHIRVIDSTEGRV